MITFRSPLRHEARTVIAGEALRVGMLVKLVQGNAIGDEPKVMKATGAEAADPTKICGVVSYIPENDLAVGYILNPATRVLTVNEGDDGLMNIPSGANVVFWYDKPIIGFPQAAVDASLNVATVREGTLLSFDDTTSKLCVYASGNAARDVVLGYVYRNEGAEITAILHKL